MKKALRKRDMTVTEDPRQAGFVIEGRVEISVSVGGRQQAKIVWAVNTMTGEEVGKAGQENQVKAGSLNGPWGRIAEIVSNAAVSGIQELFGIESRKSSRRSELPKFSAGPDLPQVPGRAPPTAEMNRPFLLFLDTRRHWESRLQWYGGLINSAASKAPGVVGAIGNPAK